MAIVGQVPQHLLNAAQKPPPHAPRQGEPTAIVADDGELKYAIYDPRGDTQGEGEYLLLWRDAIGELHDTFKRIGLQAHETTHNPSYGGGTRNGTAERAARRVRFSLAPRDGCSTGSKLTSMSYRYRSIQRHSQCVNFELLHASARGNRD